MTMTLMDPEVRTSHGSGNKPARSHIVVGGAGKDGPTRVTEAMVFGHEVEALCGYVWVPSRDPAGLQICDECKGIANSRGGNFE